MLIPRREVSKARILRFRDGEDAPKAVDDSLATEEPLEIRVTWQPPPSPAHPRPRPETHSVAVTMRTPGHDFELAAGFLFTEGLLHAPRDVTRISYCSGNEPQEYNLLEVRLRPGARFDPDSLNRNFYMTSSCGICGKAALDAVENLGCAPFPENDSEREALAPEVIRSLPNRLREGQPVFSRTGGLHAAALFGWDGSLGTLREDVGRHNAVDKVVGHSFLNGLVPLTGEGGGGSGIVVSGRASFELLQKALMAGISTLVAVGAPSSLAVDFARRYRMTLIGFAKGDGFNVYSGEFRLQTIDTAKGEDG